MRASGLRPKEFSTGKEFRAETLSWWSSRLRREAKPKKIQLARVVRLKQGPGSGAAADRLGSGSSGIIVEVSGARLVVPRGVDPTTLEVVLQAVGKHTSEAGR